jgi:competence protein ComEC
MLRKLLTLTVLVLGLGRPLGAQQADSIEVIFFDVGQGDAVLVRSFEGRAALIDAGGNSNILDHLRAWHVDSLDLVITSHPHRDHIGGMPTVLGMFAVAAYMDNGQRYKSGDWNLVEWVLGRMDVPRTAARADTFALGSTDLRILPPPGMGGETNNESVGVLLEFGKFKALFTGDSQYEELQYFLSLGMPTVTLMKAAHHGARNGLTPGWVQATKPEVVVVSVGRNNSYGHPNPWVLRYYGLFAKAIYRTDVDGTVRVIGYKDGTWRVETAAMQLGTGPSGLK